jgi:hypothetical protein
MAASNAISYSKASTLKKIVAKSWHGSQILKTQLNYAVRNATERKR